MKYNTYSKTANQTFLQSQELSWQGIYIDPVCGMASIQEVLCASVYEVFRQSDSNNSNSCPTLKLFWKVIIVKQLEINWQNFYSRMTGWTLWNT